MASERISYSSPKTPIHVIQRPDPGEEKPLFANARWTTTFLTLENIATAPLIA
jgi:hypothetical protein